MKKLTSLFIIIALILSLFACKPSGDQGGTGGENGGSTPKPSYSFINGTNLEKFSIVYSENDLDYAKRAAEYIQSEILKRTELNLPLVKDSEASGEHEIVVGNTSRAISERLDAECGDLQFAILAEDNAIALEADYFVIAAAAYYFIETYVPSDDFSAEIPKEARVLDPIVKEAKNFILLIGDGMGVNQTLLFDHLEDVSGYSDGESQFYGYMLPYQGYSRTDSLSGTTDSAAGGTALSTGYKTYNEYIGIDKNGETFQTSIATNTATISPMFVPSKKPIAFFMFAYMPLPSLTASTMVAKLSSVSVISAAPLATSVPVIPIAQPISAAFSAGASLTPSPVIDTT